MNKELLTKLRNRQPVTFYKSYQGRKRFFRVQLNRSINSIAWQRFVSADRRTWTKLNDLLSLHDIDYWLNENKGLIN
jgi:hypothetical protein